MPSFLADLWYHTLSTLCAGFAVTGLSMRVERRYPFPMTGPVLVVSNHQSFLDPVLVGLAVRRPLVYLARKTLFKKRPFNWLIRSLNAVPIDQDGVGKEGIKTVLAELGKGRPVLVFPEGTRTEDGIMQPFQPGIHLLIKKSHAPIVPVGIAGAYDAWPIWRKYPHLSPIFLPAEKAAVSVVIGKALDSARLAALPRRESLDVLFQEIAALQRRAEEIRRKD